MLERRKLHPVLEGAPWTIGANPRDLGPLQGDMSAEAKKPQEVVDHHVWRDAEGMWRLWACVRGTAVGRILYGWKSPSLEQPDWEPTGVAMRRDQSAGECVGMSEPGASPAEEWIQSPYVIRGDGDGLYHMFYGGSWADPCGTVRIGSICHATSRDGIRFERVLNAMGRSVAFQGPGEARDPCVVRIGGLWHAYFSGNDYCASGSAAGVMVNKIWARTSLDLTAWSGPREVQWGGTAGTHPWSAECPHVVERGGYFYLLRTADYAKGKTFVYRSEDPFDFGMGDDSHLVGMLDVAAPEIVVDAESGREYVTSNKDLRGGCRLQRLGWVEA